MNRIVAIVLTILTTVLCGCPGLFYFGVGVFYWPNAAEMAVELAQIQKDTGVDWSLIGGEGNAVLLSRLLVIVAALLAILIPIVVGFISFRLSRKKTPPVLPTA